MECFGLNQALRIKEICPQMKPAYKAGHVLVKALIAKVSQCKNSVPKAELKSQKMQEIGV